MEMEKSKVLIQFLVPFRQFGDVLSFLYARTLRGYTATVLMLILVLATVFASWFVVGKGNRILQNSFEAVTIFCWPPGGGNSGTKSICMVPFGHVMCSLGFCRGGCVSMLSTRDSLLQCRHGTTHLLTNCAIFG